LGLPTLSSFFIPAPELRSRRDVYRDEALAAGIDEGEVGALLEQSWGMRCVFVADDQRSAIDAVRGPFMAYQERLASRNNVVGRIVQARLRPFEEYLDMGLAIFGTPDQVVDGLGRYAESTGYTRVLLLVALAGLPGTAAIRSMELFSTRVMPQLRGALAER
jgi:alkanesulfonate monooxygenase SsuD/methylene tetrahydromethanopterin reductase-like flavin-dependent oxidoreductase (luciferase family)